LGIGNAIGKLALDGGFLKIGADLVENEGDVGAGHGDLHDGGHGSEIEKRQPASLADHFSALILDHMSRRWDLEKSKSEHGRPLQDVDASILPILTCSPTRRSMGRVATYWTGDRVLSGRHAS